MIKDLKDFKRFIKWAKEAGLSGATVGEYSFQISQYEQTKMMIAEQEELALGQQEPEFKEELKNPRAQHIRDSNIDEEEYEDILFHSSTRK